MAKKSLVAVPAERIEQAILIIRGHKVLLDADLATMYGVTTKRLNEQYRRNRSRFPTDFAFQLTVEEFSILRSQFATSRSRWGGRRYPPIAFTEHGAVMLAAVLNTDIAIETSVGVVRAFMRLREIVAAHKDLAKRLDELEQKYDGQFAHVFDAIRKLTQAPSASPREMGYHTLIRRPVE